MSKKKETNEEVLIIEEIEDKKRLEELKNLDKLISSSCKGTYKGKYINEYKAETKYINTECVSIDLLLKGLPLGRIIECRGGYSSGKSTLCFYLIGAMQKKGYINMLIDSEASYTEDYGELCGINTEDLIYLRPDSMEDCIEGIRVGLSSGLIKFIWIDSLSALVPSNEVDKDIGGGTLATRARLMSTYLPQIVNLCAKYEASVIWINQERTTNIGGYGASKSGTGGKALPFYASLILDISKESYIEDDDKIGQNTKIKVIKSKLKAKPFQEAIIPINYPNYDNGIGGVDLETDMLNKAIDLGIIEKRGSWFIFEDEKEQGQSKIIDLIKQRPDLKERVKNNLYKIIK